MELREVENHKVACTSKFVHCEFSGMGCPRKGPRQDIERHAKEDFVHHLNLCRKKIEQLETALGGQVRGGKEVSRTAQGVVTVKPSFPAVIIPIEDYHVYQESNFVWERAEFKLAEMTFCLRLEFVSFSGSPTKSHIVKLKYCAPKKSVCEDTLKILGDIEAFSDHYCNSLILKTKTFQIELTNRDFIKVTGFDIDRGHIPKNMYLKIKVYQLLDH